MNKSRRLVLFAFCLLAAFLQGWIVLKANAAVAIWFLYFGIIGSVPFLLLNGPHGDTEGAAGIVGGLLYVLTNGIVYYWIVKLILKWRQRR